jgi:hypothetical protein
VLFAWEETHRTHRGNEAAAIAGVRSARGMPVPQDMDRSQVGLALFDPDGRQWHFMPQEEM